MSQREIKFRAVSINVPDMDGQWVTTDEVGFVNFFHALKEGDLDEKTLGQWTGLMDKNGKEIYEGDILGYNDNGKMINISIVNFQELEVEAGIKILGYDVTVDTKCEVIGNIYENPDLLK